jgi:hypothetical protein
MGTITLSKEAILDNGISIDEAILLVSISNNCDLSYAKKLLIDKGYITATYDNKASKNNWRLTNKGIEVINNTLVDSEKVQEPKERLEYLAKELKNIFPEGKKDGTNYYWSDGIVLICKRLKLFFSKYGNNYTDDQIINATKRYVQSFNGNYQYMKLLKYFIFKDKLDVEGNIENNSDLINYIENEGQEDSLKNNWEIILK